MTTNMKKSKAGLHFISIYHHTVKYNEYPDKILLDHPHLYVDRQWLCCLEHWFTPKRSRTRTHLLLGQSATSPELHPLSAGPTHHDCACASLQILPSLPMTSLIFCSVWHLWLFSRVWKTPGHPANSRAGFWVPTNQDVYHQLLMCNPN